MQNRLTILFTSTIRTSFIIRDLNFLRQKYTVVEIISSGLKALLKIFMNIRKVDITFTWFASTYSFWVILLGKLFRKKSVIVIGGVDVADYKEINYGIWLNWWKAKLVKYSLRNATKVLAVDPSLIKEAKRLAKYDGKNVIYIPTGYDPDEWFPAGEKENFVLSVGVCEDEWRFVKKGFDKLVEVAKIMNQTKFVLIGVSANLTKRIKNRIPENVTLVNFVTQQDLLSYYQKAKVYCQVSYTEGLPNALCEAMLCGCIPVGTNRGGIPTAIDNVGFIVDYGDINGLVKAINEALASERELCAEARDHIIQNFHKSRRESELTKIINQLMY